MNTAWCIISVSVDLFVLPLLHVAGGYLAASYALRHPEQVKHLVLVGPAGIVSICESRCLAVWVAFVCGCSQRAYV
jgi:alpha-beta hydrolase superfamily lysophospholipase